MLFFQSLEFFKKSLSLNFVMPESVESFLLMGERGERRSGEDVSQSHFLGCGLGDLEGEK